MMAEENQQIMMPPQSAVPQSVAGTMTVSNNVDPNSQHTVSTPMSMASGALSVSQAQSMANVQTAVNTSSGTPVHMTIPAPPPPTPAPTAVIPQSSGHHQTMIQPISSIPQNQIPQVQVIQQPLSASYLQQLYTPQQQMLFPGNLTLQPAGMTTQTIQGLGATQGLSLQLQTKTAVDPKTSVSGTTLQAVNPAKGISLGSSNMMAAGQVIGSGAKSCLTPQMFTNPAKSSAVLHNQQGFSPATSNQTVVIGQLGVLPNQQFSNHKTLMDTQKGKTYMVNQQTALQPKSPIYPSSASIPTSSQVLNGNQLKQLSQPQIITSQPTAMFTQAQILGSFQALGTSLPPGITWATPGCLQSPALLAPNPIFIRSQQSDMFIQSPPPSAVHLPVAQASAPLPPTTFATAAVAQRPKQDIEESGHTDIGSRMGPEKVRPASSVATQTAVSSAVTSQPQTASPVRAQAKVKSRTISSHLTPVTLAQAAPQMATTQTQTQQQPSPQPAVPPQQRTDAANQTKPTPEMKSIATQSKTVGTDPNKQQPLLVEKSQNVVAPIPKTAEVATVTPVVQPEPPVPPVISTAVSTGAAMTDAITTTTTTTTTTASITEFVLVEPSTHPEVIVEDTSTTTIDLPAPSPPPPLPPPCPPPSRAPPVEDTVRAAENEVKREESVMAVKPVTHVVKDKQPQKAIVKPQILTHVIDGYIIQEGPEPFPVSRSSLLTESITPKVPLKDKKDKPSNVPGIARVLPSEGKQKIHKPRHPVELAKCEFCEKLGAKSKFKKSKRFCSKSCVKRHSVSSTKRQGRLSSSQNILATGKVGKKKLGFKARKGWRKSQSPEQDNCEKGMSEENQEDSSTPMDESTQNDELEKMDENGRTSADAPSEPETISPLANIKEEMEVVDVAEAVCTSNTPLKWSCVREVMRRIKSYCISCLKVQDVWDFVRSLPGCSDYADEFRSQEIDGQALLLLKEDHLISAMSMKLGPALKLIAKINDIKEITNS